jgi:hypothetical protein
MPRSGTRTNEQASLNDSSAMSSAARIRERPLQFPAVSSDVRRALLHTFPFAVYFRVLDEIVIVLAVLHLRSNRMRCIAGAEGSASI